MCRQNKTKEVWGGGQLKIWSLKTTPQKYTLTLTSSRQNEPNKFIRLDKKFMNFAKPEEKLPSKNTHIH